MKTKKLVSLFLAVAMIFAVLTVSVSADLEEYTPGEIYPSSISCSDVGYLVFTDYSRHLQVTTEAINLSTTEQTFHIQVQCTINYASGNNDFDYNLAKATLQPCPHISQANNYSVNAELNMYADSNETIIGFISEYHIGDINHNSLWDGYIDKEYVLGINA